MGALLRISKVDLDGVQVVDATPYADDRGSFARWFCSRELVDVLSGRTIMQINYSRTVRVGAVRGLHFQHPPHGEMKLIRCLRGRVFDVAVDLRADSPTFLRWHAEELSADNARMVVIPEGFAHGYQVLEPDSELLYLHTATYEPSAEGGLRFNDPTLAIQWPLAVTELSPRDANHPLIDSSFNGITP
jgi:dTDP-4-dehydrorhamnose 3,5-epimerase